MAQFGPLTIDPSGRFLYVSGSRDMLGFSIDANTGALTPIGSAIPYPGTTMLTYVQ